MYKNCREKYPNCVATSKYWLSIVLQHEIREHFGNVRIPAARLWTTRGCRDREASFRSKGALQGDVFFWQPSGVRVPNYKIKKSISYPSRAKKNRVTTPVVFHCRRFSRCSLTAPVAGLIFPPSLFPSSPAALRIAHSSSLCFY